MNNAPKKIPNKAVSIVSHFIRDCKRACRNLTEIHLRVDLWEQFKDFARRDDQTLEIDNEVMFGDVLIKNSKLAMGQPFYPYFKEIAYEA